jgi:NTE family protein
MVLINGREAQVSFALVLGGGGVAGVAWEIGVLAGLRRAGVDVTGADLVIGTSAGSIVGALLTGGVDLEDAVASQRSGNAGNGPDEERLWLDVERLAEVFATLFDESLEPIDRRARIGAIALASPAATRPDAEEARLAYFAERLPVRRWPADRVLLVTGVDAETGEEAVWRRESGVDLLRAVAASCAVPAVFPPVTINGRRYMDGGMRSGTNADLAEGAERVLVIAPMAGMSPVGAPEAELDALRASGAEVTLIAPDEATTAAFGTNLLDVRRREPSLEAGLAQGAALAGSLVAH